MTEDVPGTAREILKFWFIDTELKQRFTRDEAFDQEISRRYRALHQELANFTHAAWLETPETLLATVIVLDQFSRNLFRDDPRAYASDDKALLLAELGIACGHLDHWGTDRGSFLLMPLMHAEHLPRLERCVALFESCYPSNEESLDAAKRHREPIARFGRYPSRNKTLGRVSSEEELAWLKDYPSGF